MWDVERGGSGTLDGHTDASIRRHSARTGRWLLTARWGREQSMGWHSGAEVASLDGHTDAVCRRRFSLTGADRHCQGTGAPRCGMWRRAAVASLHDTRVRSIHGGIQPDMDMVVTASGDGSAKVWDAASGVEVASLDGHTDWVNSGGI